MYIHHISGGRGVKSGQVIAILDQLGLSREAPPREPLRYTVVVLGRVK